MRIIFCNITYLRYYDGRIAGEMKPVSGGRWIQENGDAHEKWNFLNVDGYCYGYVQGTEQMHIERIDKKFNKLDIGNDVTVVWCAKHPKSGDTVIVGWYEHAKVFRFLQYSKITPVSGMDRTYRFSTEAENAYLLPEEERTMVVGRAAEQGLGKGFGRMNYWYADNEYARETIISTVLKYIENHKACRINALSDAYEHKYNPNPLTDEEIAVINDTNSIGDFEFLQLSYRMYDCEPNGDNAYRIGATLTGLCQYKKAIEWYKKAVELNPDDWEAKGMLVYNYVQCEQYEESVRYAKELLECNRASEPSFKDEVYCMLADGYFFQGNISEAIKWQDRIIKESNNKEIIEYTKQLKKEWEETIK